jgi:hypothetical protein
VVRSTRGSAIIPPELSMKLKSLLLGERKIAAAMTVTLSMFFPAECIDSTE